MITVSLTGLRPVPKNRQYYIPSHQMWVHYEEYSRLYFHPTEPGVLVEEHTSSNMVYLEGYGGWEEVFFMEQTLLKYTDIKHYSHA